MSITDSFKDKLILFAAIILMSATVFSGNTRAVNEKERLKKSTETVTGLSEEDIRENGKGLSGGTLAIYEACVYSLMEAPDTYVLLDENAAKEDVSTAYKAFEYDYPEVDIRADGVYAAMENGEVVGISPSIVRYENPDYYNFEFPGLTDTSALGIFKFVKSQCFYSKDPDALNGLCNSAYSYYFTDGEMVCEGYAKFYKILLDKAGIPNRILIGGNHAWNIVWLEDEGRWVECDPTWDDSWAEKVWTYDQYGEERPVFLFGLTTEEMTETHGFAREDYCNNLPIAE